MKTGFDHERMRSVLASRVGKGHGALLDSSRASGIPASTLANFIKGRTPRLSRDTALKACAWLGFPFEQFVTARTGRGAAPEGTLDRIESALLNDPALSTEGAVALSEMMRSAYSTLAR